MKKHNDTRLPWHGLRYIESLFPLKKSLFILNLIKAYEALVILHVEVKKQLDCKANRKIESSQETVSEQCSLQVSVC